MRLSCLPALTGLALTAGLLFPSRAQAEYPSSSLYLGIHCGLNAVLTEWELGMNAREAGLRPATGAYGMAGIRVGYQFTPRLSLELGGSLLPYSSNADESDTALEYDLDGLFHLTKSDWAPFVLIGYGSYHQVSGDLTADFDPNFHFGAGLRGLVAPWMAARLEARDMLSDGFGGPSDNLEVRVAVDFFLAGKPDKDKDGIADENDACPEIPGVASAGGCPDRDGDTVADGKDACPDDPGDPALDGCPDTDGDGIADVNDSCPHKAGPKATGGCPDTDNDGVIDKLDACPDVPGKAELKGCPDADNDGITDAEDACPNEPGPKSTKGCPDRDHDGVADRDDKCPDVTGLKQFQGCVPEAVKKFTGAIQGIYFETAKATIKPASFPVLDRAVAVLKEYPELKLLIEGHTDDVGDDAYNMRLSEDRAKSVREYLVSKGIDTVRLQSKGYGETKPAASNKTNAGRAKNRRIEFTITGE
jgi:outer membrane protein OmpA-like peptidoglycan-associated protein